MQFEWAVALWKAIRDALQGIVPALVVAVIGALAGVLDTDHLTTANVPLWLVPIILGAFSGLRNVLRNRFGWPVAIAALCLLGSGTANAQTFEGLGNPHFGVGVSYLREAPVDGTQRANLFMTANVPGIRLGSLPCYALGVGLTAGDINPGFSSFELGVSVPALTCDFKSGQFGAQIGYARLMTGPEDKPDGYYLAVTFALKSPTDLAEKRARKVAKKTAELAISNPTK